MKPKKEKRSRKKMKAINIKVVRGSCPMLKCTEKKKKKVFNSITVLSWFLKL